MAKKQSALEQILERLGQATKAIGSSGNMFSPASFGAKVAQDSGAVEAIRKAFIQPVGNELKKTKAIGDYLERVDYNKQYPFFNNTGNNPAQWMGKVIADGVERGPFEAAQDLTNPVLMNPYIEPFAEPAVSKIRVANYNAGRPNDLINNILGQTDAQVTRLDDANVPGKDYGPETFAQKGDGSTKQKPSPIFGDTVENIGKDLANFLKLGSNNNQGVPSGGIDERSDSLIPSGMQNILANPKETYYNNILEPAKNVINFSPLFYSEDIFKQEGEF